MLTRTYSQFKPKLMTSFSICSRMNSRPKPMTARANEATVGSHGGRAGKTPRVTSQKKTATI